METCRRWTIPGLNTDLINCRWILYEEGNQLALFIYGNTRESYHCAPDADVSTTTTAIMESIFLFLDINQLLQKSRYIYIGLVISIGI